MHIKYTFTQIEIALSADKHIVLHWCWIKCTIPINTIKTILFFFKIYFVYSLLYAWFMNTSRHFIYYVITLKWRYYAYQISLAQNCIYWKSILWQLEFFCNQYLYSNKFNIIIRTFLLNDLRWTRSNGKIRIW